MKRQYEAPAIHELGTLQELTQQAFNKVHFTPDIVSASNPSVIGSLTPAK